MKKAVKLFFAEMSLIAVIFCTAGCGWGKNRTYTFVWMTDTQYYCESAPDIYMTMTRWISEHIEDRNINFVLHTGDVVNQTGDALQWQRADEAMTYLDGTVPYSILAGNHDLTNSGNPYENFLTYFGKNRMDAMGIKGNTVWYYHDGEASAQIIDAGR